ncbi:MAG TPA: protein kinase, partial [Planctomycetota bacterium]|nr:protein kinase [Planctomycetota bacterium]
MSELPKTLGKYDILDVLGRGGMGQVYLARDPQLDRTVAIKTLLAGEQATERFLERFRREAQMTAALQHPNIVRVYDFGTEGKLHYIVMEHVDGRPLQDLLAQGRLEPERALRIAYSVARTLQFAHERRIVHRDIKPANLVVDAQGRVHILDFGLAKSLADDKALTLSFTTLGTAYYMSPEQAFGAPEEVDARADVYSLGAVLHEMLTGRPPFEGGTILAILRKIEDEDPPPAGVSPAVDDVVRRALAKDRDRRFQTAAEMADAIRACLGGPVVEPRPPAPSTLRAAPAPAASSAWAWPAAALGAAALSIAAVVALSGGRDPGPVPEPEPPAVAVTPEAELRALLSRRTELTAAELAPYREDPALARMIARHFQQRGQFTRALDYLRGYDRMMGELMSARALQRFVSPALFRLYIPPARELKGAEAFLAAALGRHFEGRNEAARLKLRSAQNAGASPGHVLLVRAHLDLCQVFHDPAGEAQRAILAALREDLAGSDELYHLPLRAVAAAIDGDYETAREVAERFAKAAPLAAESFLLQAILLQREGRIALAIDQLLDAGEMDPRNFDASIHLA